MGDEPIVIGVVLFAGGLLLLLLFPAKRSKGRVITGVIFAIIGLLIFLAATIGLGQVGLALAAVLNLLGIVLVAIGDFLSSASEAMRDVAEGG